MGEQERQTERRRYVRAATELTLRVVEREDDRLSDGNWSIFVPANVVRIES